MELFTDTKRELEETSEQLGVTTNNLIKTSEKLQDTHQRLVTTTQDRDEQKYLVSEHVEVESCLYSDANQVFINLT